MELGIGFLVGALVGWLACHRALHTAAVRTAATAAAAAAAHADRHRVVGFYEDEYPVYANEWTHELQSPVTAEELNALIGNLKLYQYRAYRKGIQDAFRSLGERQDERVMLLNRAESTRLKLTR
jgi:hypothetical protein